MATMTSETQPRDFIITDATAQFDLRLPPLAPPAGFGCEECEVSEISDIAAFNTEIDGRGIFHGVPCCTCVVSLMHHSSIVTFAG